MWVTVLRYPHIPGLSIGMREGPRPSAASCFSWRRWLFQRLGAQIGRRPGPRMPIAGAQAAAGGAFAAIAAELTHEERKRRGGPAEGFSGVARSFLAETPPRLRCSPRALLLVHGPPGGCSSPGAGRCGIPVCRRLMRFDARQGPFCALLGDLKKPGREKGESCRWDRTTGSAAWGLGDGRPGARK